MSCGGASIALNDLDWEAAEASAREIAEAYGVEALAFIADVTKETAVEELFRAVEDAFGQLDVLVNNAGIGGRRMGHLLEICRWRIGTP